MNTFSTTGIALILLYFALYYSIQGKKSYRAKSSGIDNFKQYADLLQIRLKEDVILIGIWGLLVSGIFLCLFGFTQ